MPLFIRLRGVALTEAIKRYVARWQQLGRPAKLYLVHAALLTGSLAIIGLFFNLAILTFGYTREQLGLLNAISIRVAVVLSLPLWWFVTLIGLRTAMIVHVLLQVSAVAIYAFIPSWPLLLLAVGVTGAAAVIFQVSSPPFMMRHSDAATRDHLFSANAAINIGVAGIGTLIAGSMPALFGWLLGVPAESERAYRATFMVAGCVLALAIVPLLLIRSELADNERPSTNDQPPAPTDQPTNIDKQPATGGQQVSNNSEHRGLVGRLLGYIPEAFQGMVRHPWPLLMLLASPFFISWGAALLMPYLNLFFKEHFAVSDSALGGIFALLNITTALAALLAPALSVRLGKIQTVVLTQALSIPFLLVMGFVPFLGLAVGAALARGALFNMGSPLYDAFAMERSDEQVRPIVIGIINGAYTVGYIFAPEISVDIQQRYGFGPLFLATTACYVLAMLANLLFFLIPWRKWVARRSTPIT
jgi:MFS family permease